MSFNTIAKRKIRVDYNLPLIKDFYEIYNHKCRYFGLTGENFHDIIDWKEYIETVLTIEYDEGKISSLIKNVQANKLDSRVSYISGDIIKLILLNNNQINYPFDLINFDFLGTFIYQSRKKSKKKMDRIEVFKYLIKKQSETMLKGEAFIFLITLNGQRGRDITVFENALKSLRRPQNQVQIDWLLNSTNKVKQYQKIAFVLPSLIYDCCKNLFDIKKFKLIIYQGNKNIMTHFSYCLEKNQKTYLDFSDINLNFLLDTDVIMIDTNGNTKEIPSNLFFSTPDPFKF